MFPIEKIWFLSISAEILKIFFVGVIIDIDVVRKWELFHKFNLVEEMRRGVMKSMAWSRDISSIKTFKESLEDLKISPLFANIFLKLSYLWIVLDRCLNNQKNQKILKLNLPHQLPFKNYKPKGIPRKKVQLKSISFHRNQFYFWLLLRIVKAQAILFLQIGFRQYIINTHASFPG